MREYQSPQLFLPDGTFFWTRALMFYPTVGPRVAGVFEFHTHTSIKSVDGNQRWIPSFPSSVNPLGLELAQQSCFKSLESWIITRKSCRKDVYAKHVLCMCVCVLVRMCVCCV